MTAPRNRTTRVSAHEHDRLLELVTREPSSVTMNQVVHGDMALVCDHVAPGTVDLLILDPPYNLRKTFGATVFDKRTSDEYRQTFSRWLKAALRTLKPSATIYACAEWRTSAVVQPILAEHVLVRNRITWEREKGRGAQTNWKNTSEDIWFCTAGEDYKFHADRVRIRRPVIAPYRDESGRPKDWNDHEAGAYRDTAPANLWTDITVPFWSMPENTEHPTQKPEKLVAKLILASSDIGDVVLDPFLGSGTSAVVAKKLGRRWIGIEIEREYCALAQKRLNETSEGDPIQGFRDGVFWPRNSLNQQQRSAKPLETDQSSLLL